MSTRLPPQPQRGRGDRMVVHQAAVLDGANAAGTLHLLASEFAIALERHLLAAAERRAARRVTSDWIDPFWGELSLRADLLTAFNERRYLAVAAYASFAWARGFGRTDEGGRS
jgi:hypothetical protein